MITFVGSIFAVLFAFAAFAGPRYILIALAAAIPFSQAAAITIGDKGISPFWLGAFFVAGRLGWAILRRGRRASLRPLRLEGALLAFVLFGAYALVVTAVGAAFFVGMGVYAPHGGIDEQTHALTPLAYSPSTLAQAGYLVLGMILVAWLIMEGRPQDVRTFEIAICLVLLLSLWHAWLPQLWPADAFDNNPTYQYMITGTRQRGPFSEPSALGMFLVAAIAYSCSAFARAGAYRRVFYGATILVSFYLYGLAYTGTALVALGCLAALSIGLILWRAIAGRDRKLLMWIGGSALVVVAVVVAAGRLIAPYTVDLVVEKLGSDSLTNRNASNVRAWEIMSQTWGLGVGLGANRPSSLFFLLLSAVGIVGTLLFIRAAVGFALIGFGSGQYRAVAWAFAATMIAQAIAVPDLSTPQLWLLLAFVAQAYGRWLPPPDQPGIGRRAAGLLRLMPSEFARFRTGLIDSPRRVSA